MVDSVSPIKQADANLVHGAGAAAGLGFTNIMGAMEAGMGIGATTEAAEAASEGKSCIEQGLKGLALKKCQNENEPIDPCGGLEGMKHQECRDNEHAKIDAEEAAKLEKAKSACSELGRAWDEKKGRCGKPIETTE